MRINIDIDDTLMARALKAGSHRTKKSAIEHGLKLLVQINAQQKLRALKGKIHWEGNLESMRTD